MFGGSTQKKTKASGSTGSRPASKAVKLHSIGGLLKGRKVAGSFAVAGTTYNFSYAPARSAVVGRRLQITGELTIAKATADTRSEPMSKSGVKATLVGIQSGIGSAPPRKNHPQDVYPSRTGIPAVDSSGSHSFTGVLYMHFEPLNGRALGINADLTRLQLNVRIWPIDNREREIQAAFSDASDALLGKEVDQSLAEQSVTTLNKLFSG
jgi:hypothetical protein